MVDKLNRTKKIVKTSIVGILTNVLLSIVKAVFGFLASSIAIILDAVNNLSDALSSFVTLIGAKLSSKKPDKEHPYGHGRGEYISALIVGIIIFYAGIMALIESIKKIIEPTIPDYSWITLAIVSVAVLVKIFLGIYFQTIGKTAKSNALIGSGKDAMLDAIISFATLISAIIFIILGVCLEAYLGIIISLFIFKAGYEILKNSFSQILGERVDGELAKAVTTTVKKHKEVLGVCDLVLNNYGIDKYIGSIHIEVADTMNAGEIDALTRCITKDVLSEHGVVLAAVGIYSQNIADENIKEIQEQINNIVFSFDNVLQMHGLYINNKDKTIAFDLIFDFTDTHKDSVFAEIERLINQQYPDFSLSLTMDIDTTD